MDNVKPKASVMMLVYDEREEWLRESLEGISNQTFKDFEFIIVLDKPDNTKLEKIIKGYAKKDKRIIFLKNEKNIGRPLSRNKAVSKAKGDYIAVLDADDAALPERLEKQVNFMLNHADVDLLFTWAYFINEKGEIIKEFNPPSRYFKNIRKNFFKKYLTIHPSMMIKSKILKELKYDPSLLRSQDCDLLLRCLQKGYNFWILEDYLIKYRLSRLNYDERINKQLGYSKYSVKLFNKNFKYFYNNIYFLEKYFKYVLMYAFLKITPRTLIKNLIKLKDER